MFAKWFYPDAPTTNTCGGDPGYDEAYGPRCGVQSVRIDEAGLTQSVDCWQQPIEGEEERLDRILFQHPDDPPGKGETENSVREEVQRQWRESIRIEVDPRYQPEWSPVCRSIRRFNGDVRPVKTGSVTVVTEKRKRNTEPKKNGRKPFVYVKTPSTVVVSSKVGHYFERPEGFEFDLSRVWGTLHARPRLAMAAD